jgi:hypothetical protein
MRRLALVVPFLICWNLPDPAVCPTLDHLSIHVYRYASVNSLAQERDRLDLDPCYDILGPYPDATNVVMFEWPLPYAADDSCGQPDCPIVDPACFPTPASVGGYVYGGM